MREGFFTGTSLAPSKQPLSLLPQCGACGIHEVCDSPKLKVGGEGQRKILIIGEAPEEEDDKQGIQFVGPSGKLLRQTLSLMDINMKKDCWLTSALICHPPKGRKITQKEIRYCQPNLKHTLDRLKPEIIIPLGDAAIQSLLKDTIWKDKVGSIRRWAGFRVPCQKPNAWICPTWHPSFLLKQKDATAAAYHFAKHLTAAFALKGRPWDEVPDYKSKIEILQNPSQAAQAIAEMTDSGKSPMAFDLETDRAKPDRTDARIVCCSISDGKRTIAFPWQGDVIGEMRRFVRSRIAKIASNMKFEDRWIWRKLGLRVRNWLWDTMLAAHWMDARPDITGLKFQSFIHYGMPDYSFHLEAYLEADHGNDKNKIHMIPIRNLLEYCGLDSLLEWLVATKQMKEVSYGNG